ncbi:DUF2974 domain-containing protein [Lactobacillus sp. LL6]|uniref:DUF2974 domain-containing protein n=1 Tax=Lactobacillus sp. LL6 TaxID=2596827 RepID=UPI001184C594|nr:DUF2974 domain-containing protein [Lactobacillus sp. LL6]TSO26679.1 DUF2974 domain-containing protein [Lactobacillus sp. LL6]
MDANLQLTDLDRIELTKKSYQNLNLGERIEISGHFIGIVTDSIYEKDGLRAFVITNQNEVTILYKGSYGFLKGNPTTWRDEWLKTNLPILVSLLINNEKKIPSQLNSAAKLLNKTINKYPKAHFYIYGHSLGSINAQYALANCHHPSSIYGAYLYEGTNIWLLLTQKQRQVAAKLRTKIYNYVDIYDPVTLGITATHHMVGRLMYVDSTPMSPIKQHMWGGYRFDKDGNLLLREVDDEFLRESLNERKFLTKTNDLAKALEKKGQAGEVRKLAAEKLTDLKKRFPDNSGFNKLASLIDKAGFLKEK